MVRGEEDVIGNRPCSLPSSDWPSLTVSLLSLTTVQGGADRPILYLGLQEVRPQGQARGSQVKTSGPCPLHHHKLGGSATLPGALSSPHTRHWDGAGEPGPGAGELLPCPGPFSTVTPCSAEEVPQPLGQGETEAQRCKVTRVSQPDLRTQPIGNHTPNAPLHTVCSRSLQTSGRGEKGRLQMVLRLRLSLSRSDPPAPGPR